MNVFAHIPGNDLVKGYLLNMVQKKAIGNSLLFAGPADANKEQFALAFAKLLMGESAYAKIDSSTHPDIHVYRPEGKIGMHSITTMRQFCEEVYMPPFEGAWKIFIIHDADRMLSYSANALLKTFEEPSLDTVIILLSSNPSALLPTVLSRCRTVRFQPVGTRKAANEENLLRSAILEILCKGKFQTYTELSKSAARMAEMIEEIQLAEEEILKNELNQIPNEQLSAFQRQAAEKEMEGAATICVNGQAKALLRHVLSWYRDLHLLQSKGNVELLENSDYEEQLKIALHHPLLSLDTVQRHVKNAILSLERSTALNLCLEKLFLELQLI
jgi:DNA polymerase III subunit delta'